MSTPQLQIWLWVVGSQVGYLDHIDDCIIHGIFSTEARANACIAKLQANNPGDAYCVLRVEMDSTINVGFSTASLWVWHEGKDTHPDDKRSAFSEPTNLIAPSNY
jgi:hypothetical protein